MPRIVKLHHLQLNHNTWAVRYQIPKDCRHLFDGKREYLKSTGYKKPEVIGAELVRDIKVATIQKIIWNFRRKHHMLHRVMTEKVKLMSEVQRDFALKDVKETMKLHDRDSDYYAQLEAEYDALLEAMG